MIKIAGWLIVLYAVAHTLLALAFEGAAHHTGAWFSGQLWHDDLSNMSAANSAYWLTVGSFGVPLLVVGCMVLWLDRRCICVPQFVPWVLGIWTLVDGVVMLLTPWPLLLIANVMLLIAARRTSVEEHR